MQSQTNSYLHIDSAYPIIKETVPMTSLGYSTNNKYPDFPPLMCDGRSITASQQPNAVLNEDLKRRNGITSNWQYRKFLTQNAQPIMQYNFSNMSNDIGYYVRYDDLPNIQSGNIVDYPVNTPYLYSSASDKTKPFGYVDTDLKQLYLSREELYSRRIAPTISSN
jgi:hypothetical protein